MHPGQIDLRNDRDTALKLFDLVNFIAEDRITGAKAITDVYGMVPPDKLKGIQDRDAGAKATGVVGGIGPVQHAFSEAFLEVLSDANA